MICDDCGLPVEICNAQAMVAAAVEKHGRDAVFAVIDLSPALGAVATAVKAEREGCIIAARAALDGRKAVYDRKADRATDGDLLGLMLDLSLSQDYAFVAVEQAIRAQGGEGCK